MEFIQYSILCFILSTLMISLFYRVGKNVGKKEVLDTIEKVNHKYYITTEYKIKEVWCVPD